MNLAIEIVYEECGKRKDKSFRAKYDNGEMLGLKEAKQKVRDYIRTGDFSQGYEKLKPLSARIVDMDTQKTLYRRYHSRRHFVYCNRNDEGLEIGDCIIRALSKAFDMTWREAFNKLASVAVERCMMPSSVGVAQVVLKAEGWRAISVPNIGRKWMTVLDFCKANPKGSFVLFLNRHAVTVKNGKAYDLNDVVMERKVHYAWTKTA